MEAAERDAAIRAGTGDRLPGLRLHRFRIAVLVAEGGRGNSRQIAGPTAVFRRNLLGRRRRVPFFALALRPAAATWPASVRAGTPTASAGCGGRLAGTRRPVAAAASGRSWVLLRRRTGNLRLPGFGCAAANAAGKPLEGHQCGQQPNERSGCDSQTIHERFGAHSRGAQFAQTVMHHIGASEPCLEGKYRSNPVTIDRQRVGGFSAIHSPKSTSGFTGLVH